MNLAPGDIFEQRYEVRSELGGGEFSVVYRATSMDSGRDVVIRILLPPPAAGYPTGFENRFMAEAKRVSKLRHAGTVQLESYGASSDGALYLITEYISGHSLAEVMAKESISVQDALGLVKRMTESLGEAQSRGITHRELKPGNIAIPLRRGILGGKLRDYGITKYVEQDGPISAAAVGFGSPRYMSPEQILGKDVGIASNIYSLGLVFYELVTGEPCVVATSSREVLSTHLSTTDFELPRGVPSAIRPVLKRMIAKSLSDRFESADELLDALREAKRSGSGLIRLKVAKMVEALEASDDDGADAGDTIVDPNFLDPGTDESTKERVRGDQTAVRRDQTAVLGSKRAEVLTPTNVEVDDVTQLADDNSAPTSIGDASENEPTDELPDKVRPKSSGDDSPESKARSSKPRSSKSRSSKSRSSRSGSKSRSKSRSSKDGSKSRSRSKSKSSRGDGERRSAPAAVEEDRVSGWVAVGAIVGAVALALTLTGVFLYLRSPPSDEVRRTRATVVATQNPLSDPVDHTGGVGMIPSVSIDVGVGFADLGEVPTGCGTPRSTGWGVQTEVVGLTELDYEAYVPSKYTGTAPVPVILVVHPPGMYGRQWVEHVRLTRIAESLNAVIVSPVDKGMRPWLKDLPASKAEFERVLDHATATFCVDLGRVFGVGMSSGAQALAQFSCDHPDRFRALGLVAHWMSPHLRCDDRRQPAMFMVNGLLDRVSPIEGGSGCFNLATRLPLVKTTDKLRTQRGCADETTEWAAEPDGDCQAYKGCSADLVACEVPTGVHAWPGSQHSVVRCIDEMGEIPATTQFPTTSLLLRFLTEQMAK